MSHDLCGSAAGRCPLPAFSSSSIIFSLAGFQLPPKPMLPPLLPSPLHSTPDTFSIVCSLTSVGSQRFLTLPPFNTASIYLVVIPNHKIILLPLHNGNFAVVINLNVNVYYVGYVVCAPQGITTHSLRTTTLNDHNDDQQIPRSTRFLSQIQNKRAKRQTRA